MPILVFDGVDGAGKSTAATLCRDYLNIDLKMSPSVRLLQMPGATDVGQELRRIIKSNKFSPAPKVARLIFMADFAQFHHENAQFINDGGWVICDRYAGITDLIYGHADGVDPQFTTYLQALVLKDEVLLPDIFFVFKCSLETAMSRKESVGGIDRIEAKGVEHYKKIVDAYSSIEPWDVKVDIARSRVSDLQFMIEERCKKIVIVDAERTPQEVMQQIKDEVNKIPAERR